jgi:hypothetical protein
MVLYRIKAKNPLIQMHDRARNITCYNTPSVEKYIDESANSSCNILSERLSEWRESKIMCSSGVLCLNEHQSRLCPGSTATEFMLLAPAAVTRMVITITVMIMTV